MYQVLLVDDEIKITWWLSKSIAWQKYGFEICEICTGGLPAIQYLQHHHVDLVITDIRMPGLSGLELIQKIQECRPSVKTLILSGYNQFEYAQQALKYGVKAFLLKPLDPCELVEFLQKLSLDLEHENLSAPVKEKTAPYLDFLKADNKIEDVMTYIDMNYNKDISLKTTAELFEFHPAYLGKLFKDTFGSSFNTYIHKKRIGKLKKLLVQSSLPVSQLLESVGYHNPEYFYTIFKKYEGITFSEYRSGHTKEEKEADF